MLRKSRLRQKKNGFLIKKYIFEIFDSNLYTLGVFIDLSEAFDTVDLTVLLKKCKLYSLEAKN